jgi:hypothetical protein
MLSKRQTVLLAAAALLSGFSISIAWAEQTAVPKTNAYPQLAPQASTSSAMTADEQEKLKKDLIKARERQSQIKAKENAARTKPKKP